MFNPANIKENYQHALGWASDLTGLFGSWILQALPLQRLVFGLWFIATGTTLITNDDPWQEVWVIPWSSDGDPHRLWHNARSACESENYKCARTSGHKNMCTWGADDAQAMKPGIFNHKCFCLHLLHGQCCTALLLCTIGTVFFLIAHCSLINWTFHWFI